MKSKNPNLSTKPELQIGAAQEESKCLLLAVMVNLAISNKASSNPRTELVKPCVSRWVDGFSSKQIIFQGVIVRYSSGSCVLTSSFVERDYESYTFLSVLEGISSTVSPSSELRL